MDLPKCRDHIGALAFARFMLGNHHLRRRRRGRSGSPVGLGGLRRSKANLPARETDDGSFDDTLQLANNTAPASWNWEPAAERPLGGPFSQNLFSLGKPDDGYAALIDDLKSSGLLKDTLIMMTVEFGRTVGRLNSSVGRDHFLQQFPSSAAG